MKISMYLGSAVLALSFVACDSEDEGSGTAGDPCSVNADCSGGHVCAQRNGLTAEVQTFNQSPAVVECIDDCQFECFDDACFAQCAVNCGPCDQVCEVLCDGDGGCIAECVPQCTAAQGGGAGGAGGNGGSPGDGEVSGQDADVYVDLGGSGELPAGDGVALQGGCSSTRDRSEERDGPLGLLGLALLGLAGARSRRR